jgi:hypothetical protein
MNNSFYINSNLIFCSKVEAFFAGVMVISFYASFFCKWIKTFSYFFFAVFLTCVEDSSVTASRNLLVCTSNKLTCLRLTGQSQSWIAVLGLLCRYGSESDSKLVYAQTLVFSLMEGLCSVEINSEFIDRISTVWFNTVHNYEYWRRESLVGIATGYRLDDKGVGVWAPVGSRNFSSLLRPDRFRGSPSLLSNEYRKI